MILFNITFKIDHDSADLWLKWVEKEVLPKIESEPAVTEHKLLRLLMEDHTGMTYCIQHYLPGEKEYLAYNGSCANLFLKDMTQEFGEKVLYFSTALQVIK